MVKTFGSADAAGTRVRFPASNGQETSAERSLEKVRKAEILLLAVVVMAAGCRPVPPMSDAAPVSGTPPASVPVVLAFLEDRAGQRPISPGQVIAVAGESVLVRVGSHGPVEQDPRAWIEVPGNAAGWWLVTAAES